MIISPDTENVLDYLDQAAGQGLRKRNDMGVILELSAARGGHEELNTLVFHGRHLHNLYSTVRKVATGAEGYATLEREFAAAVETVRDLLAKVMVDADEEQVKRFETLYYQATQGSLRNLIDLAHDLGVLKGVQNERKYGDAGPAGE